MEAEAPATLRHSVLDEGGVLGAQEQTLGAPAAAELVIPLSHGLGVVLRTGEELTVHLPPVHELQFISGT